MSKTSSYATFLLLLAIVVVIYAIPSLYFERMNEIWQKSRRVEVLKNEIRYLETQADRYREAVAPLVLRLFSFSRDDGEVRILYSGKEIWRGSVEGLNITQEVEHFGSVRIWVEDSRIVSSILGMPYRYTLRTYYDEELAYVVEDFLSKAGRIDEAAERDKEELSVLENELRILSSSPLAYPFIATPLISIGVQFALLSFLDRVVSKKYAGVLTSPYVFLPAVATYVAFATLTIYFHSGILMPLHAIGALYLLTSLPSLISPIVYAYERIVE